MSEPHAHDHGGEHPGAPHESHVKTYLWVFGTLAVFTAIEYFYAKIFKDAFFVLVVGLMSLAIFKAALVGMYFMHLKFEGKWVYAMLVPAGILAVICTCALYPDLAMQPPPETFIQDEESTGMLDRAGPPRVELASR